MTQKNVSETSHLKDKEVHEGSQREMAETLYELGETLVIDERQPEGEGSKIGQADGYHRDVKSPFGAVKDDKRENQGDREEGNGHCGAHLCEIRFVHFII